MMKNKYVLTCTCTNDIAVFHPKGALSEEAGLPFIGNGFHINGINFSRKEFAPLGANSFFP